MDASKKWVLMGIANYVDQDLKCWPSMDTLAKRLGLSKVTLWRNINELVEMRVIQKDRENHYGSNMYRINMGEKTDFKMNADQNAKRNLKQVSKRNPNLISESPSVNPKNQAAPAPSKKVTKERPVWADAADSLYVSDKTRYDRLVVWIGQVKKKYHPEVIRDTLVSMKEHEDKCGPVENWYPYVNGVASRLSKDRAMAENLKLHEQLKNEEAAWFGQVRRSPAELVKKLAKIKSVR